MQEEVLQEVTEVTAGTGAVDTGVVDTGVSDTEKVGEEVSAADAIGAIVERAVEKAIEKIGGFGGAAGPRSSGGEVLQSAVSGETGREVPDRRVDF